MLTQLGAKVLMIRRMQARLLYARKGQTSVLSGMDGKMPSWLIISLARFSNYLFGLLTILCLLLWMLTTLLS